MIENEIMSDINTGIDLSTLFHQIECHFDGGSDIYALSFDASSIERLIHDIDLCMNLVHQLGLFSSNEDIDDYPTLSIKVSMSCPLIK